MNWRQDDAGPISPQSPFIDSLCGVGWVTVRPIQEATARSVV